MGNLFLDHVILRYNYHPINNKCAFAAIAEHYGKSVSLVSMMAVIFIIGKVCPLFQ